TGSPIPVLEGITTQPVSGGAEVAFSESGVLVYTLGGGDDFGRTLVSVDRKGNVRPLPAPPRAYFQVRLSPDGTRLALAIQRDIWVYELARSALTRLTSQPNSVSPVWSPDSKRVAYALNRPGGGEILAAAADGSGGSDQLLTREQFKRFNFGYVAPYSWSPDGRVLAVQDPIAQKLWTVSLEGDRKPQTLLSLAFANTGPQFSPDGRWLAYSSNESGRPEVYVQPFPGPGAKTLMSTDGGTEPRWSPNGRA